MGIYGMAHEMMQMGDAPDYAFREYGTDYYEEREPEMYNPDKGQPDYNYEEPWEFYSCDVCGSEEFMDLGKTGVLRWLRCRACHAEAAVSQKTVLATDEPSDVDLPF